MSRWTLWKKLTPEQKRERNLLRQWRGLCLKNRLELLPLELVQRRLCRPSASEKRDTNSVTPLTRPRDKRNAASTNGCGRLTFARAGRLSRLRSRLKVCLTRCRRRLLSKCLAVVLRLLRWSLSRG